MKSSKNLAILMHVWYHRDKNTVLIIQNYTISNCLADNMFTCGYIKVLHDSFKFSRIMCSVSVTVVHQQANTHLFPAISFNLW